ncbi:hypothetical protein GCM10007858_25470 [Bradyrhizobium liaoningense]|nr:hypothetical protein GCM10007858_25470 [Bradyrhizobium liaoningense]
MAERKGLVELVRGHPAVLLDDRAAGKHQDPAETGRDILAKARNSATRLGGAAARSGSWTAGAESEDMSGA